MRHSDPGHSKVLPAAAISAPVERTAVSCWLVWVAIGCQGWRSEPRWDFAGISTAGNSANRWRHRSARAIVAAARGLARSPIRVPRFDRSRASSEGVNGGMTSR